MPMKQKPLTLAIVACLAAPLSFAKTTITEQQVVEHYADLAHAVYQDSRITAQTLQQQIDRFVANPTEKSLIATQQAWLDARVYYQQSEVFRFGNSVVDDWEGQLNAWPLDEV
ncbi:iron-regulated protein A precursor [Vibrio astriarenae]|nr:iron-regulated protein A precursor [Vibrio sp. C7]